MKEYIERAAVEKFIEDGLNNPDKNKAFGHDAIEIMAEIHYMPAADVVEVVRCDNCILHENCLTEDTFRIARIDNPYCCVGRQANV